MLGGAEVTGRCKIEHLSSFLFLLFSPFYFCCSLLLCYTAEMFFLFFLKKTRILLELIIQVKSLLPLFQIIRQFGISRYVDFVMHLDINLCPNI